MARERTADGTFARRPLKSRYGRWTVVSTKTDRQYYALCLCDCGVQRLVRNQILRSGESTSCGCSRKSRGVRRSKTKTYQCWVNMIQRCTNPNVKQYKNYGGRGIAVCDEWKTFGGFFASMGEMPPGMTLERNDTGGPYCESNCRWATWEEQAKNKRDSIYLEHGGIRLHLLDWAERVGIASGCLYQRIRKGWSVERALTTPVMTRFRNGR